MAQVAWTFPGLSLPKSVHGRVVAICGSGFQPMDSRTREHRRSRFSKSEAISLFERDDRSALAYSIVPIDVVSTRLMG
jgi:hypothetical protein